MAISKWGKKVEKVLETPPEEVDIQEQISREAARLEIEQISTFIKEWMERRLGVIYRGLIVTVRYDAPMAWYRVGVDFRSGGKIYSATLIIRDEEITAKSTDTKTWTHFLDAHSDKLKFELRKALLADGVKELPTNRLGLTTSLTGLGSSFQTGAMSTNQFGIDARKASEAAEELATTLEVQEAIESIKRTIAGREPEPEQ